MQSESIRALYADWVKEDAAFSAVVATEFGGHRAGTMRYCPHLWTGPVVDAYAKLEVARSNFENNGGREWMQGLLLRPCHAAARADA